MTIRERLAFELAKNPNYEGKDATEKALVAELRKELGIESAPAAQAGDSSQAAKDLASEMMKVATLMAEKMAGAQAQPQRDAVPSNGQAGFSADEVKAMDLKTKMGHFIRAVHNKDFARIKALSEGSQASPGNGGALVPEEFRAQLIQDMLATGSFRDLAAVIPMESNYLEFPKLTADVKVYWGTENKAIATTSADFGNVSLTPFRLNAIIYTSRELFEDSALPVTDILMARFRDRVRDEENKVFMGGSGTGRPKGLFVYTGYRGISAGNALSPDHITRAYWKLPEGFRSSATFLINSRTMAEMENKKGTDGHYLYPSLQGEVKTLKGRPVWVSDYVPSSKIMFGACKNYFIGDRQQVTMETTTEGAGTWEKHQVGIKVVERVDGRLGLQTGFVLISNTGIN